MFTVAAQVGRRKAKQDKKATRNIVNVKYPTNI